MTFLSVSVVDPPTVEPVQSDAFVDHARLNGITVQKQPELIDRMLKAARIRCEKYTRRALLKQKLRAFFGPPSGSGSDCGCFGVLSREADALTCRLPRGNVLSIDSVTADGGALVADQYTLNGSLLTLDSPAALVEVVWFGGYGETAADVPANLVEGILQYATTLYEDRPGWREDTGDSLPLGVADSWSGDRIPLY